MLEVQMLFEDAPLRLLSIHHTGMTNEDLRLLMKQLAANPDDNATQAYLTCLKLGPPVEWVGNAEAQTSQPVGLNSDSVQQLTGLLDKLLELEVLQVWGLDEHQQGDLTEAWKSVKQQQCNVSRPDDSFRISSLGR